MSNVGFTRGTWSAALRKARRLACQRRETVRFGWNRASSAWVFFTGSVGKRRIEAVTSVAAAHCAKKKRSR